MALHNRIKQLRQEKNWTQADLAQKIGVKQKQISAYETGYNKPTTEVLIKLAEIFDVTLDFLVSELNKQSIKIKDKELIGYFEAIDDFKDDDKKMIKSILDAFVTKNKLQELVTK